MIKKNSTRRNTKGASLVEYSVLVGLIGSVAIGSILTTGDEVKNTFDGASVAIANPGSAGGSGGGSSPPAPPAPNPVPDNPCLPSSPPDPAWYMGGSGHDTIRLYSLGSYEGTCGMEGVDTINDASGDQTIVGGLGNDSIQSFYGGNDYFIYYQGDGQDSYHENGGNDTLHFADIAFADASFSVDSGGNARIFHGGNRIATIIQQYYTDANRYVERIVFSDATLTYSEFLTEIHEDGKAAGTVTATWVDDTVNHSMEDDGSYTYSLMRNGNDTLVFTDAASTNATFSMIPGDMDLVITLSDGDVIQLPDYFRYTGNFAETVQFTDETLSGTAAMLYRLHEHEQVAGTVNLTGIFNDVIDHYQTTDGSYTITGSYGGFNQFYLRDTNWADASFDRIGTNDLEITLPDGDVILVDEYFGRTSGAHSDYLDRVHFADYTPTLSEIRVLADA